jgi:hypothetical protein
MLARHMPSLAAFALCAVVAKAALAQESAPAAPAATAPAAPAATAPAAPPTPGGEATTQPGPGGGSIIYLPPAGAATSTPSNTAVSSSSRPTGDINQAADSFDLGTNRGASNVMRGSANAPLITSERSGAGVIPDPYTVKKGDTLWDLCDHYLHNPWEWPRVWSYNPELQNPHWIYPGDLIRLRPAGGTPEALRSLGAQPTALGRSIARRPTVAPGTIFLRDQGYLDDEAKDIWGEVGGSPDDQLLLSEGDDTFLDLAPGHDVAVGQELTVFRPIPRAQGDKDKGVMVQILGTAKVHYWDPQRRLAQAKLTESINVIERGVKIGPLTRQFHVISPVRNAVELEGQVMAAFYPHVLFGQDQIVFVNRGSKDGLVPGNRLFVIAQGDPYRQTLPGAGPYAADHVEYEGEGPAKSETDGAKGRGDDKGYPLQVVGELRVLTVREGSATCIVTSSDREIERGQRVLVRKGY